MAKSVKLLVGMSGPICSAGPGDLWACDDAEAQRLVAAGFAVFVDGDEPEEVENPSDGTVDSQDGDNTDADADPATDEGQE